METHYLLRDGLTTGPQRIDDYPSPPLPHHSVSAIMNGWKGRVRIFASIEVIPSENSWALVVDEEVRIDHGQVGNRMWCQEGCLIWLKAEIIPASDNSGRIDRITVI